MVREQGRPEGGACTHAKTTQSRLLLERSRLVFMLGQWALVWKRDCFESYTEAEGASRRSQKEMAFEAKETSMPEASKTSEGKIKGVKSIIKSDN